MDIEHTKKSAAVPTAASFAARHSRAPARARRAEQTPLRRTGAAYFALLLLISSQVIDMLGDSLLSTLGDKGDFSGATWFDDIAGT